MTPAEAIRDVRLRCYEDCPEYRALMDQRIEAELHSLSTLQPPEGARERTWNQIRRLAVQP